MTWNINEYGLTVDQLEAKYDGGIGSHFTYRTDQWKNEVRKGSTQLNYWPWVKQQLEKEEYELQRDNPYN